MSGKQIISLLFLYVMISWGLAPHANGNQGVIDETSVTLSATVESHEVPLNRVLNLTVSITWEGDIDMIEIGEIEEPILSGFDIVGTSSSNRVMGAAIGRKAVKEISYTLQPNTLGMGYIESVGIGYKDKKSGNSHHLKTQRLGVEIISPVPEEGGHHYNWIYIVIAAFLTGTITIIYIIKKRKNRQDEKPVAERIIEEGYIKELKETVDLKIADKRDAFTVLSKLFKKYLKEKYDISALEATTEDLLRTLREEDFDESLIRICENLLVKADVVKFSGQEATQSELEEAYTTVETILESHLAQVKEKQRQAEEEQKSKRKIWKKRKK